MILLVRELVTVIDQDFEAPEDNVVLYSIRPHLYRHNFPAGSLKIQLLDENKKLIGESNSVLIADLDLDTAPNDFFHGYVRFLLNVPLKGGQIYFVRLKPSGYTFNELAYIGWCNDYDLQRYDRNYTPSASTQAAMDLEFWGDVRLSRGA